MGYKALLKKYLNLRKAALKVRPIDGVRAADITANKSMYCYDRSKKRYDREYTRAVSEICHAIEFINSYTYHQTRVTPLLDKII